MIAEKQPGLSDYQKLETKEIAHQVVNGITGKYLRKWEFRIWAAGICIMITILNPEAREVIGIAKLLGL